MNNRLVLALRGLVFVSLLAACGGGDGGENTSAGPSPEPATGGSQTDAKAVDACALLDKKDIEAVIGEPVSKVDPGGTADAAGTCSWYGKETDSLRQKGVSLIAARDNGKERWTNHRQLLAGQATTVPGFGDEAFTDGQTIAGYKGNAFVVIAPLYADSGVTGEQLKPLGQRALDKLGG